MEPLDPSEEPTVELPLLGLVSAGQPVLAVEARETLTVPARLVKRHAAARSFALYVRGDSMTDDGIDTGDLVVVEQRPTAENGETVVARIDGYRATLNPQLSLQMDDVFRQYASNKYSNSRRVRPASIETVADACGERSGMALLSPPGGAAATVGFW
ncbi:MULTISPECIES: LexA family protein [unclassified Thiocapsa]|uniref:LexA family protein n=1 Tax=unclassified Thiocapsa TaxID=2641286 RepID=UPI0035B33046